MKSKVTFRFIFIMRPITIKTTFDMTKSIFAFPHIKGYRQNQS